MNFDKISSPTLIQSNRSNFFSYSRYNIIHIYVAFYLIMCVKHGQMILHENTEYMKSYVYQTDLDAAL